MSRQEHRMFWASLSLSAFGLGFSGFVNAASLGLDASILQVLRSSQFIEAQRKEASLASGDVWRRFVFREPQFSYSNVDSSNQQILGVSLTTSFPGKSLAYSSLDRLRARNEAIEIDNKKQDVAKQVTESYLECAVNRSLLEIQRLAIRDLETLSSSLSAMYESGHASQAERIGAELQVRQTQTELDASSDRAENSCRKWRSIVGARDTSPEGIPDDLSPDTIKELGSRSAEEARSEAAIESANVSDSLRWWAQAPDLTWTYSSNHYTSLAGSPNDHEWTTTFGVSVTIPILFFFNEDIDAQRIRAQARIDRHLAEVQSLSARTDRVSAAQELRRVRARLTQLREKDLALGEALVQSTFSSYKVGKLGFSELMMSRKTLSDLRTQEVQLKASAILARLRCLQQCENSTSQE